MAVKATPTFSLKDQLFNKDKVTLIAGQIAAVHPDFARDTFINAVCDKFPQLELMDRLLWIRDCLREFLPDDYQTAATVLLESLPLPCDPTLTDDDFGDFIYGPYGAFVAEYGCTVKDLTFSLAAIKAMTTRFSCEFPVRSFLSAFPQQTLAQLGKWATDDHYHVRRLVSEGTRPSLPWAKNISIDYRDALPFLDTLHTDNTRFVTRSVANHMNDISKIDPHLVVATLQRWQKEGQQLDKELQFITKHSLRTLEKRGHAGALRLLGYAPPQIQPPQLIITTPAVAVGDALVFSFTITSTADTTQNLLIDYHLYFKKANGRLAPKTFKITKTNIKPGQTLTFTKQQPLRPMTTRTLYPGEHQIELQINGQTFPIESFVLKE